MPKLLQINTTSNWGSTGKIAEGIGDYAKKNGWESWIAYGRGKCNVSTSSLIRIGDDWSTRFHGLQTRIYDNHGLASSSVTKKFIETINKIRPDIIHLHNIHGYFLNYKILFSFLKEWGGPVVWTLHDCWPYTGHCAYYDFVKCDKWKSFCNHCPQLKSYPASYLLDRSYKNYNDKLRSFTECKNLTIVPVSNWLSEELKSSFLSRYPQKIIHNGIDIKLFTPPMLHKDEKHVLGVASIWEHRKGLSEFLKLRELLPEDYKITLVGLNNNQIKKIPAGIHGINRTENVEQLIRYYSKATVFVNPTLEDNFPTTNLEALACGTPVVTYATGGSPESIDDKTGIVVPYKATNRLVEAITTICNKKVAFSSFDCRKRAETLYDKDRVFQTYIDLYNSIIRQLG